MKRLLILTLLALPAAAAAQALNDADLDAAPAVKSEEGAPETLKRPDSPAILAELSTALRLSSKQEERISAAVNKKTKEFDRLMKEYDKNLAEEKKWLYRVNENRHGMVKINREMPDLVREFLDDEQRQAYDKLLEAKRKPAPAPAAAATAQEGPAAKPVKKRRLIRRKKVPGQAAAGKPAPAAVQPSDETAEEPGQVMVDKDSTPPAQPKKKRVLKKRPITKDATPVAEYSEKLEGSKPDGQEPDPDEEEEEDAGSYP